MSERRPRTKQNTLETLDALAEKGKKKKAPLSEKKILSATGKSSKLFSEKLPLRKNAAASFEGFKPEQKQALGSFAKEAFVHPTKSAPLQKIPKKRWRDTAREKILKESIGALRDNLSLETKNLLSKMKKKFAAPEALPRPKNAMPVPPIDPVLWQVLKSRKGNDIEFRSLKEPLRSGVMQSVRRPESLLEKTKRGFQKRLKGLKESAFPDVSEVPSAEWGRGMQRAVAEKFAQPEAGAASGVVELPASRDDMSENLPNRSEEFGTGALRRAAERAKERSQKKGKPKEEQLPEQVPNPELARLIEEAEKGSGPAPRVAEGAVAEKAAEKVAAGNDSWESKLEKMDTLVVNGDDGREEESVSDDRLKIKTVLAKIAAEKKLTGAMFLNYLNDMGGERASPKAIEKIMTVASQRLDKGVFKKLRTIVSPSHVNKPEIRKEKASLEPNKIGSGKVMEEPASEVLPIQAAPGISEKQAEATGASEQRLEGRLTPENIARSFKSGKPIEVKISGNSEDRWFVTGSDGKDAVVIKYPGGGKMLRAVVPLEELNDLNKVATSHAVEAAPVSAVIDTAAPEQVPVVAERVQDIRRRIEELNDEAAGHTPGHRTGKEIQAEALALENELRNLERAGKTGEGKPVPEEEAVQMTSEGPLFSDAQKESLSKALGEQSEGTPKEWREKLRDLIRGADKRFEAEAEREILQAIDTTGEQGERGKEYVAERLEVLQEEAKGYGPTMIEAIGSVVERYNKLNWKTKLAITGALMLGAAYMPIAAGAFTAALYGQRLIGAIGMGMNKRKKLDAKIAANPEHWLAGKSELTKNAYVTLLSAGYMAATSFAVHEGVEGLKAVAHSEWVHHPGEWLGNTREWLGDMLGHGSAQSGLTLTPEELAALAPSTDALETLAPIPDMPEAPSSPYAGSDVQEHIDKAREAIERMQKLSEEQANILKSMPDGSEASPSDLPDSGGILRDNDSGGDVFTHSNPIPSEAPVTAPPVESPSGGAEFGPPKDAFMSQEQELTNIIEKQQQLSGQSAEAPFGLDPIDGHPMSELEAQRLAELRNAMHDPRETGAWPPGPPEEKGFFEKLFGGDKNAAETVTTPDHILTLESGVYPLRDGHFFAESDSIEGRLNEVQKFLTANPSETVYSLDDSGKYQIPWHLVDSVDGKKIPMPDTDKITNGGSFLGFGSRFISAPTPEDFAQQNPLEYSAPAAPVEIPKVDIDTAPASGEVAPPPAAEDVAPESEIQAPTEVETPPVDTGAPHTSGEAAPTSATESAGPSPEISSHPFESIKAVSAEGKFSYSTDGRPLSFDLAHGDLYPSSLMDYGKKFLVDNYENMVPLNNPKANAQQILSEVFFHKQALEYLVGIGGNNSPEADFLRGDIKLLSERVERLYGPIFKK